MIFSLSPGVILYSKYMAVPDEEILPSVTWYGVNTLYIKSKRQSILIDPYFSRLNLKSLSSFLFSKVNPDRDAIQRWISKTGITKAEAVLLTHTHVDHALDASVVAEQLQASCLYTPPLLYSSLSKGIKPYTVMNLAEQDGFYIEDMNITVLRGSHMPFPVPVNHLESSLTPLLSNLVSFKYAWQYIADSLYSFYIEVNGRRCVVMGSAGLLDLNLEYKRADTLIMSIGGLDLLTGRYCDKLLNQVYRNFNPRRILLSHWDDFTRPLEQPLKWLSHANNTVDYVISHTKRHNIKTYLLPPGLPVAL